VLARQHCDTPFARQSPHIRTPVLLSHYNGFLSLCQDKYPKEIAIMEKLVLGYLHAGLSIGRFDDLWRRCATRPQVAIGPLSKYLPPETS
jgi:hypothetical protein